MASDDLLLACRMSGLSLDELWMRYLELGGNRSRAELAARLDGTEWPVPDERYLAVVADEELRERGLPLLASSLGARGAATGSEASTRRRGSGPAA